VDDLDQLGRHAPERNTQREAAAHLQPFPPERVVRSGEHPLRLLEERPSLVGQRDPARRAFEEHDAERALELLELTRERRLRDEKPLRGAPDMPLLRDDHEGAE